MKNIMTHPADCRCPDCETSAAHDGSPVTILVVDDEDLILSLTHKILERHHFEVFTANNGQEGLTLLEKKKDRIQVILLDMTMPKMNGLETYAKIREISSSMPVLLSSGYAEQDKVKKLQEGDHGGAVDFIQKPYQTAALIEKIRSMLPG